MKTELQKCAILLVYIIKLSSGAVNIPQTTFVCGEVATVRCDINPLADIRWERNGVFLVNCYSDGTCDFPSTGVFSYNMDISASASTITIDPVTNAAHGGNVFSCADSGDNSQLTLNISAPLKNLTMTESVNGNTKELTVNTNCVTTDVKFTWSCVLSVNTTQSVNNNCNVSSVTTSSITTGCLTGSDCSGAGLEKKSTVLSFEEYAGTPNQTVQLAVSATYGNTTVTAVSSNTYSIMEITTTPLTTTTHLSTTYYIETTGSSTSTEMPANISSVAANTGEPKPCQLPCRCPVWCICVIILGVFAVICVIVVIFKKWTVCKIKITTGNKTKDGTKANTWIKMISRDSKHTWQRQLINKEGEWFEKGSVKTFTFRAFCIEQIQAIQLWKDKTGEEDDWYVKKVEIEIPSKKKQFDFTIDCLISQCESSKTFPVDVNVIYVIKISTADTCTNANMWINIKGPHGQHTGCQEIVYEAGQQPLESGSFKSFPITALCIEHIQTIEIGNDGTGEDDDVYVNKVEIEIPSRNKQFDFTTECLISHNKGDGVKTSKTFTVDAKYTCGINIDRLCSCKVADERNTGARHGKPTHIDTDNESNASTSNVVPLINLNQSGEPAHLRNQSSEL